MTQFLKRPASNGQIPARSSRRFVMALLLLTALAVTGCVGVRMGVSWPAVSLVGEQSYILLSSNNFIVQIDPADGTEVKLRDSEGRVRVDPGTGEARTWDLTDESPTAGFYASPVLIDDSLLAAEYNQRFVRIDNTTARINNPTGQPIDGQPIADFVLDEENNRIYIGYNSADLEAFDADTLDVLWRFDTQSGVWAKPLLHDDVLYFTSMDHYLYAVDTGAGELIWSVDLGGASASTPLLVDDRLYVGTFNRTILEITLDGELTASYTASNWIWGAPVADGSTLYAADLSGFVYALSLPGLQEQWAAAALPTGIRPSPLVLDNAVVVVSRTGTVAWLSKDTGSQIFSREIQNEILSDLLYVPSGAALREPLVVVTGVNTSPMMVAFTASDGQRIWEYSR